MNQRWKLRGKGIGARLGCLISLPARIWLLGLMGFHSLVAEEPVWVFEGVIETVDESLTPFFRHGWVYSGSFEVNDLAVFQTEQSRNNVWVWEGGIKDAEITIDEHFLIQYEANQTERTVRTSGEIRDVRGRGQDFLGIDIPMAGKVLSQGEQDLQLRWNQIWLYQDEGKWLRGAEFPLKGKGPSFQKGWFRLSFQTEGEEKLRFVEGYLTRFHEVGDEPVDPIEELKSMVAKLGKQLNERDTEISFLRDELNRAKDRASHLDRMVSVLIEEREKLKEEKTILESRSEADEALLSQIDQLTAEKVVIEEELKLLREKSAVSQGLLTDRTFENYQLAKQIESLTEKLEELEQRQNLDSTIQEPHPSAKPLVFNEEPIEKVESEARSISVPAEGSIIETRSVEEKEESTQFFPNRRRGPRSKY